MKRPLAGIGVVAGALAGLFVHAEAFGQNVRLTNDFTGPGYVSTYTLATGTPLRTPC